MAFQSSYSLSLFLLCNFLAWIVFSTAANIPSRDVSIPFNRTLFPPDFLFGVGSAAYQVEGAWNESGKGPSNWDNYTHTHSDHFNATIGNGDVAVDFYHRYKEDIELAKSQGLDAFRISISWSRILPHGKKSLGVNEAGVDFYNNLIDEFLAQGITPFVTIFHWDVPQALEDEYQGFLNSSIIYDFRDYAKVCFERFGDRVKYWTTLNEPYNFATLGYDFGAFPPGHCSGCSAGNSSTEPYKVAHNLLRAHAAATKLYRNHFQADQKGKIGIANYAQWFEPYNSTKIKDQKAATRGLDFMLGWFLNPVVFGDYPKIMKHIVGERLPKFTLQEKESLKGSCDFIGLNYYTAYYAKPNFTRIDPKKNRSVNDSHVDKLVSKNGNLIGLPTGTDFYIVPWGFQKLLVYVKNKYRNSTIYITECGMGESNINTVDEGVNDNLRIHFYKSHLKKLYNATMLQKVNVKGFFGWSFHDNFEWYSGYTVRYGINFIDYNNNLARHPKKSAYWIKAFLLK